MKSYVVILVMFTLPVMASVQPANLFTGSIRCIAVDGNAHRLYAATYGNGVFRSDDGGENWTPCAATGVSPYLHSVFVDSQGKLYVASETGSAASDDGGATWTVLTHEKCLSIAAVTESSGTRVFVGTEGSGLLMRAPNASVFVPVAKDKHVFRIQSIVVHPDMPERVFMGTEKGVYCSQDAGVTWTERNAGLARLPVRAMTCDPTNPERLFVITQISPEPVSEGGLVYRSDDAGVSWSKIFGEYPTLTGIAVNPANPQQVMLSSYYFGILVNNSGGSGNWVAINENLLSARIYGISFQENTPFAASSIGVYRRDGGAWNLKNTGIRAANIQAILPVSEDGSTWLAGCMEEGIWKSVDGGTNWVPAVQGFSTQHVDIKCLTRDRWSPSRVYAGTIGRFIYLTDNLGDSWKRKLTPGGADRWVMVLEITSDENIPGTVYAASYIDGVFRSTDYGEHWSAFNGDMTIFGASVMRNIPGIPGGFLLGEIEWDLFRSVDGGGSYTHIPLNALIWLRTTVFDIQSADGAILVGTDRGIYRSEDQGMTYRLVTLFHVEHIFRRIAVSPWNPKNVYAAGDNGVILWSGDAGASWISYDAAAGIPKGQTTSLALDPGHPGRFLVGVDGKGVYIVQ